MSIAAELYRSVDVLITEQDAPEKSTLSSKWSRCWIHPASPDEEFGTRYYDWVSQPLRGHCHLATLDGAARDASHLFGLSNCFPTGRHSNSPSKHTKECYLFLSSSHDADFCIKPLKITLTTQGINAVYYNTDSLPLHVLVI